jgi:hypothetical protein
LNATVDAAGRSITSPVRGLRPTRAAVTRTVKVPNPGSVTRPSRWMAPAISASARSITSPICRSDSSGESPSRTRWISSLRVMLDPLPKPGAP